MNEFVTRMRFTADGINDLTGNAWTNNNGVTFDEAGRFGGKAAKFDGTNHLTANHDIDLGTGEFTISFHAKITGPLQAWAAMLGRYSGNYVDLFASQRGNNNLALGLFGDYASAVTIADGNWHHIAFVREKVDGSPHDKFTMYADGIAAITSINQVANTAPIDFTTYKLIVGWDGSYGAFTGLLDDICIMRGRALWTSNFTPPHSYLLGAHKLYIPVNSNGGGGKNPCIRD